MIDIYFEIEGKRVEPEEIADTMMEQVLDSVVEDIKKELNSTYCEEHEEYPTVIMKGIEDGNINLSIEACCQDLIDRAEKRISN